MATEQKAYSEMARELETIMVQIEDINIDVDVLISKIKEAAVLVRACKEKLKGSEQQITSILATMGDTQN
ncbi:MAG TPA: exodeoxyribonuclease VII small subunit [Syntrophorhabdaceae bacterium]|nr:exodeoxyribonuclease VII small subunit [Syntrophorhabdaceae bacterium]